MSKRKKKKEQKRAEQAAEQSARAADRSASPPSARLAVSPAPRPADDEDDDDDDAAGEGPARPLRLALVAAAAGFFLAAGLLVYARVLSGPFIFDDLSGILHNPTLRGSSWDIFWNRPYRGLVNLTFAAQVTGKEATTGFHVLNVFIHVGSAVFAMLLVRELLRTPWYRGRGAASPEARAATWLPVVAGAIFLLHPIQTQAVAYIIQRYSSMMGMFYLAALWLYVAARNGREARRGFLYAGVLVLELLACTSKEPGATLPIAIVLIDVLFFQRSFSFDELADRLKRRLPIYAIFFAPLVLATLYLVSKGQLLSFLAGNQKAFTRWDYLWTQGYVVGLLYPRLLLLPVGQSLDHDLEPAHTALQNLGVLAGGLASLALVIAALLLLRRSRIVSFAIVFYFLTLAVSSSFIPIYDLANEHRLYLATLALAIVIPVGVSALALRLRPEATPTTSRQLVAGTIQIAFLAVCVPLACIYGVLSIERNRVWTDPILVWEDVIEKYPDCARAWSSIGMHRINEGEWEKAVASCKKALDLAPGHPEGWNNLGKAHLEQDQLEQAEKALLEALRQRPGYHLAANNLGLVYFRAAERERARAAELQAEGKLEEAAAARGKLPALWSKATEQLEVSVKSMPGYLSAWINLGSVQVTAGRIEEAVVSLNRAIDLSVKQGTPEQGALAHFNLGLAFIHRVLAIGSEGPQAKTALPLLDQAHASIAQAGRLSPALAGQVVSKHALIDLERGKALAALGRHDDAVGAFERFLKVAPRDYTTHNRLGLVHAARAAAAEQAGDAAAAARARTAELAAYQQSLQIAPEQDRVENLIGRIRQLEAQLGVGGQ